MYDPADMMAVFAIFVALAGIAYFPQLFASAESSAPRKLASDCSICDDLIASTGFHVRSIDESVRDPIGVKILMTFPDAHIAPDAHKHFLSSRTLPEGTIAFKRAGRRAPISILRLADRSRSTCFVASDMERANVAVKGGLQFRADRRRRFFRLNQPELDDL